MAIHTIFIPSGMSVEQVWAHIKNGLPINTTHTGGKWVNVDDTGKVLK